ncbi:MAG TPA: hypothetical protein VF476_12485 [Chitinophagaceae bacterium]
MITAIHQSFLEARASLPPAMDFDGNIVIISVGEYIGAWSLYHVDGPNETVHFVFTKDQTGNQWLCADTSLQRWLDSQHAFALRLLNDVGN